MIFICIFSSVCPERVSSAYGNTLIIFIINCFITILSFRLHGKEHHRTGNDKYEGQGKCQNVLAEFSSSLHAIDTDSSLTSSFVQCVHTGFLFSSLFIQIEHLLRTAVLHLYSDYTEHIFACQYFKRK